MLLRALRPDGGVVVGAAGEGVRAAPPADEPKQFRSILGVPMLLRALRPFTFHPDVALVVIAVPAGVAARPPEWLATLVGERLALVAGGASRAQSVRAGLAALPAGAGVVLVHDGARPFVSRETIDARSEEHTSELQSLAYLVCRLLLEKKKKKKAYNAY